jgi:hypothetical protein
MEFAVEPTLVLLVRILLFQIMIAEDMQPMFIGPNTGAMEAMGEVVLGAGMIIQEM